MSKKHQSKHDAKKEAESQSSKPSAVQRPVPYSSDEAKSRILLILREGETIFSSHLIRDIRSGRHGASHQDVLHVLQNGDIISSPAWDEENSRWKYKVEGVDLEEEELRAITIIIEEQFRLFIVTAY